jgi:hypothetical protein
VISGEGGGRDGGRWGFDRDFVRKTVVSHSFPAVYHTLIKKKIKFSSYIRKFRMEQLQSHIYITNGLLIYGEIFAHFLIY